MMTRSQFLRSLVGLGAGAVVVACSSSDGDPMPTIDAATQPTPDGSQPLPDAPTGTTCATTNATISANHGHTAMIPAADIAAGVQKTYDIQGGSPHPHTIVVTAAMFTMLKAGQMVTVTSSNDAGHTHGVTIKCA